MVELVCLGGRGEPLVDRLIDGGEIEPEAFFGLAERYEIAVVKPAGARLSGFPAGFARAGVMATVRDNTGVALVPEGHAKIISGLASCLPDGGGWVAVACSPATEIAQGYREALATVELLEAGRRPTGTYRLTDVLVEYAVTRERAVADRLAAVIRPLRRHPVLWDTLMALIDADQNRSTAARRLFVHRSTLDYRLRQIAEITGLDPATVQGAQQLTVALIAESITGG